MKRSRRGYLMAMVASVTIIAASTGGIAVARDHQERADAAAQVQSAALAESAQPAAPAALSTGATSPDTSGSAASPPASITSTPTPKVPVVGPKSASSGSGRPAAPSDPISTPVVTPKVSPTSSSAAAAPASYKDGQYTATGSYDSPGGIEKLGVTLTLKSDKIITVQLDLLGGAGLSHGFQSAFASGFLPQVSGKDIDSVHLGAVAGSSLTGLGFNDALKQIEGQARA